MTTTYEVKFTNNGLPVPSVQGVCLHSIFDPIGEGNHFADSHIEELNDYDNFIVLGLGMGYHITSCLNYLNQMNKKFRLFVLEPDQRIIKDFTNYQSDLNTKITILSEPVEHLFNDETFLDLLLLKPAVLIHKSSYQQNPDYYQNFLKYRAPKEFRSFNNQISPDLKKYINMNDYQDLSVEEILEQNKKCKLDKQSAFLNLLRICTESNKRS